MTRRATVIDAPPPPPMNRTMDLSPLVTFTVILRPPVTEPGRSRRWSAHCLDLTLQSAEVVEQEVEDLLREGVERRRHAGVASARAVP